MMRAEESEQVLRFWFPELLDPDHARMLRQFDGRPTKIIHSKQTRHRMSSVFRQRELLERSKFDWRTEMNKWMHSSRAVAGAVVLFGALESAQAAVVVDPTQPVAGIDQLELSQQWWQWALSIPASTNPLLDTTGALAHTDNNGPVFFVAGNTGGLSTRNFSLPAGKPIFFPIMNAVDIEIPPAPDCPAHPGNPLQCAFDFIPEVNDATNLHATLDGQDLLTFPSFRQKSTSFFTVTLPTDNVFGFAIPAGPYDAVSDGFWVALEGLTPGQHTLIFGGTFPGATPFTLEVTDSLTVVPEPTTFGLLLLGVLALLGRRRCAPIHRT